MKQIIVKHLTFVTIGITLFVMLFYTHIQKSLGTISSLDMSQGICDTSFFSVNNPAGQNFTIDCLNINTHLYSGDNRYAFFGSPENIKGIPFVKTPNVTIKDDQSLNWTVNSEKPATVYILSRHIPGIEAPQWIKNNYTRITDNNLSNITQYAMRKNELGLIGLYDIYQKEVQPGTVAFSGASTQTVPAYSMYIVGLVAHPTPSKSATPSPSSRSILTAFPEAQGYGALAKGGRGGKVMHVTNLSDSGAGSLRECVEASGARTCIFRIGGTIILNSSLDITNPFLTIAGQTAPGGGITLRTSTNNNKGLFVVRSSAHDVIVRYIRSRPGPGGNNGDTLDAITINSNNVIFDHVSASWGIDENVNIWYPTAQNISFQWSIISEGLSNSIHPQGEHSKGLLMGDFNKNISVHHTLFAHNMDRHPEIKGDPSGVLEAINNVVYNYGWRTLLVSDNNGVAKVNIVGNYFKPGPNSPNNPEVVYYNSTGQGVRMFVKGNIGPHRLNNNNQQFQKTNGGEWNVVAASVPDIYLVTTPFSGGTVPIHATDAETAYSEVLNSSGASGTLNCRGVLTSSRDSVDQRIINDVRNKTGKVINHPSDVGGWPTLAAGTHCNDVDWDGMADEWESMMFGNISRGSTTAASDDFDNDGYTDLEEYLNGTDPTKWN